MKRNLLLYGFVCFMCIFTSSSVLAYDEPTVNLGYTSFLDGGPPAGPGWYFQNYFQYYSSNRLRDGQGHPLPVPRTDLHAVADIIQLIYLSTKKVLGANLGVSAVLPSLVSINVNDGLHNSVLQGQAGPANLFIGPALQFDPIKRKDGKGPLYVQRLELDVVTPVGRNSGDIAINPSTNFWSLNPYWAATIWFTTKFTTSFRLHYLWNAKTDHPATSFGPGVYSTQAGQAVFANIAAEYALTEEFHFGVNGYAFNQFTDTRANGINIPGRREKVWAIGPGILCGLTKNQFVFFNLYFENDARNRPQGTNFIFRYVLHM